MHDLPEPKMKFLHILVVFLVFVSVQSAIKSKDKQNINNVELEEYTRPSLYTRVFQQLLTAKDFIFNVGLDNHQTCSLCQLLVDLVVLERKAEMTLIQLWAEMSYICVTFVKETDRVCTGVIDPYVDVLGYMIDRLKDINGTKVCGLVLQDQQCEKGSNYEWTIDIPSGSTVEKAKPNGTTFFNILHISDIHYDPRYTPNKKADCGEPLCCQSDQDDGAEGKSVCGYWSSYHDADVPMHTIEETLNQTKTHKFDYIYFTGDIVSHRVWETSVDGNTKAITEVLDKFVEYYGDVPVYPILGNHEPHPVNTFSSEGVNEASVSTQWLYDLIFKKWSKWLPVDEVKDTILKGGYYTVSPRKGFRVIVLNNNVCDVENWWLLFDDKDPYGQLKWLSQVLLKAEENKEIVHILAHMPTNGCLKVWSREFNKIVKRFANTIAAQFYGHSHRDEFYIYYDKSNISEAINVGFNGASLMPDNANPSYKLYNIDEKTFDVLDFQEWTFNLTLANLDPKKKVEWYQLYSFKDSFGVESLVPSEIDGLVQRMAKNHTLLELYHNYYLRNSDSAVNDGCDETCQKNDLCQMVSVEYGETEKCQNLRELYDE